MLKNSILATFFIIFISKIFGQTTFNNLIVTGMHPDPSICRVGDDFYLVTSTFEYFPCRLSDVFGIRVGSYEETEILNEISCKSLKGKKIELNYKGKTIETESSRFDIIESKGAEIRKVQTYLPV
jgi:Glycosyl hydrolases family 43